MKAFLIHLLASVLVLLPSAHAEEKTILWAVIELPPISMFTIPNPEKLSDLGNGSTDIALRAIAAPQPDHSQEGCRESHRRQGHRFLAATDAA